MSETEPRPGTNNTEVLAAEFHAFRQETRDNIAEIKSSVVPVCGMAGLAIFGPISNNSTQIERNRQAVEDGLQREIQRNNVFGGEIAHLKGRLDTFETLYLSGKLKLD